MAHVYIPTRGWVEIVSENINSNSQQPQGYTNTDPEIDQCNDIIKKALKGAENYHLYLLRQLQKNPNNMNGKNELRQLCDELKKSLHGVMNWPSPEDSIN
jgi:hypothetical protein